ncbi:MAG: DUF429 domain-containing protein [Fervidicoccaceae archaeon]|jgi:predicted nuclease with RNAse H fold
MNSDLGKNRNLNLITEKIMVFGIDLSLNRPSSICLHSWNEKKLQLVKVDGEEAILSVILSKSEDYDYLLVAIDAPLSLNEESGFRDLDRLALSLGCKVLPISMEPMKKLAETGSRLSMRIKNLLKNAIVFETHPWSAAKLLGFSNTEEMVEKILGIHLRGDDADAAACCLVGSMLLLGKAAELVSEDGEDIFVIPEVVP